MASTVEYKWLPGPVGEMLRTGGLSTTATIPLTGKLVITTGHIGLDLETGELVKSSLEAEFEAVFNCLDAALKNAGVKKGFANAHKVIAFLVDPAHEGLMMEVFRRKFPGHFPTWTSVANAVIVVPGMHVEIQAEALLDG